MWPEWCYVRANWDDVRLLADGLAPMVTGLISFIKLLTFVWRRTEFVALVKQLRRMWHESELTENGQVNQHQMLFVPLTLSHRNFRKAAAAQCFRGRQSAVVSVSDCHRQCGHSVSTLSDWRCRLPAANRWRNIVADADAFHVRNAH